MRLAVTLIGAVGLLLIYSGITWRGRRTHRPTFGRVQRLTAEAGIAARPATVISVSVSLAAAALVVVAGATSSLVIAVVMAAMAASWPFALLRARREKRLRRLREEWPDAIATLIASIRAGVSLPESCCDLATRAGEGLAPSLDAFTSTYLATGSFGAGLERLRSAAADPIADRVAVALGMAHEVGGTDLVRVLRTLGDFVRDDLRVRKEVEARWSWTVTAARVAAAAPWIVLLLMATRPEAASAYNSPGGVVTIVIGAIATLAGYRLMLRAARLPSDRRLGA